MFVDLKCEDSPSAWLVKRRWGWSSVSTRGRLEVAEYAREGLLSLGQQESESGILTARQLPYD